jgi:hypothetical protein
VPQILLVGNVQWVRVLVRGGGTVRVWARVMYRVRVGVRGLLLGSGFGLLGLG